MKCNVNALLTPDEAAYLERLVRNEGIKKLAPFAGKLIRLGLEQYEKAETWGYLAAIDLSSASEEEKLTHVRKLCQSIKACRQREKSEVRPEIATEITASSVHQRSVDRLKLL